MATSFTQRVRRQSPYVLMVLPALAIFAVFFIVPALRTVLLSFTDFGTFHPDPSFVGLDNYFESLTSDKLLMGIRNSLLYALATVVLQSLIALPVALLLNSKLPFRNGFRAIYFAPAVLSTLVVGYLFSFIFSANGYGLVNQALAVVGVPPVNWLGDPNLALWTVISTQVWQWFGYQMVIYLANLASIDTDLYEAAALDGAGRWESFVHITLPGLLPAFQITIVTGIIAGLKVFDIIYAMTGGGPGYSTETVLTLMYRSFSDGNYGVAASAGVIFLILTMIIASALLGFFRRLEARAS